MQSAMVSLTWEGDGLSPTHSGQTITGQVLTSRASGVTQTLIIISSGQLTGKNEPNAQQATLKVSAAGSAGWLHRT